MTERSPGSGFAPDWLERMQDKEFTRDLLNEPLVQMLDKMLTQGTLNTSLV